MWQWCCVSSGALVVSSFTASLSLRLSVFSDFFFVLLFRHSLIASMRANILEQSKELSILRALGLTKWQLQRLYVYEAFVLVLCASLLGAAIGSLLAWTMLQQRQIMLQLPLQLVFPSSIIITVAAGALFCAIASSWLPARELLSRPIAAIQRTII